MASAPALTRTLRASGLRAFAGRTSTKRRSLTDTCSLAALLGRLRARKRETILHHWPPFTSGGGLSDRGDTL